MTGQHDDTRFLYRDHDLGPADVRLSPQKCVPLSPLVLTPELFGPVRRDLHPLNRQIWTPWAYRPAPRTRLICSTTGFCGQGNRAQSSLRIDERVERRG